MSTAQIYVEPNAVAVALPDEHVVLCHEIMGEAGIRVHSLGDVEAAVNRIAKAMPQLVVAGESLPPALRERIEDTTTAVGAVFVHLADTRDHAATLAQLEGAVADARARFGRSRR